jgi:hypothetical protein
MARLIDSSGLTSYALIGGTVAISYPSAGAIKFYLRTSSGNEPSVTEPMFIALRSISTSPAQFSGYIISAPLSVTISNGSTLGVPSNNWPIRVWVAISFDDVGRPLRMSVANYEDPTFLNFQFISEDNSLSITADNGTGNADIAQVNYANFSGGADSYRYVAFIDWPAGLNTIGDWSTAPSAPVIHMCKNGGKLSGDVFGSRFIPLTATSNFINLVADTDTIPTGGATILSPSFQKTYTVNLLLVEAKIFCSRSLVSNLCLSAYTLAGSHIGTGWQSVRAADDRVCIELNAVSKTADSLGALKLGGDIAGTTYVNSLSTGRKFGGGLMSGVRVTELIV